MDTIPAHTHNGTDSPRIKIGDMVPVTDAIPTKPAKEGTMAVYVSGATYRLYIHANKVWKYVNLT